MVETCEHGCNSITLACNPSPLIECEPCPSPKAISPCVKGKEKWINYACGPETDFKCESYEEEKTCEVRAYPKLEIIIAIAGVLD